MRNDDELLEIWCTNIGVQFFMNFRFFSFVSRCKYFHIQWTAANHFPVQSYAIHGRWNVAQSIRPNASQATREKKLTWSLAALSMHTQWKSFLFSLSFDYVNFTVSLMPFEFSLANFSTCELNSGRKRKCFVHSLSHVCYARVSLYH